MQLNESVMLQRNRTVPQQMTLAV